jgi:hypothetical protein
MPAADFPQGEPGYLIVPRKDLKDLLASSPFGPERVGAGPNAFEVLPPTPGPSFLVPKPCLANHL